MEQTLYTAALAEMPRYKVEALALTSPEAAEEAARRYADLARSATGSPFGASMRRQIAKAWLLGLSGTSRHLYTNYQRPLAFAYSAGVQLRRLLTGKEG